ncbi:hypothetical protein [Schnuerera sp.]|nr:hypothetical protein [Schnuerera sp.]HSH35607.1 hypothetical protein [Schnuerera sp.]
MIKLGTIIPYNKYILFELKSRQSKIIILDNNALYDLSHGKLH